MATIVTRAGKGSALTHNEVDANFNNLNSAKVETSTISSFGATLVDDADAGAARTTLGLGSTDSPSFVNFTSSGTSTLATVDINAGAIDGTAIGSSSASTGAFTTLTGGNTTLTGYLRGPATFTIDPATHGDNTGSVVIAGNLTVNGTTTTVNSETLNVADKQITVAFGAANAAAANGAGIKVDGADAILSYDATNDRFTMNKSLASNLVGNVTGNVTGNTSGTAATVTGAAQTNITSVGTLTALTVTGEITANGGIALGDNDKATFGASDDLEILHDGSNSKIIDSGTGDLLIAADNNITFTNAAVNENKAIFTTNGPVTLYHDNSAKFATTATGIDVTGSGTFNTTGDSNGSKGIVINTSGTNFESDAGIIQVTHAGSGSNTGGYFMKLKHNGSEKFTIKGNGDVTATGNVGIGTSSPAYKTQIYSSGDTVLSVVSGDSSSASLYLGDSVATRGRFTYNNTNDSLAVYTDNNERMRITNAGSVGIGTTSPGHPLSIRHSASTDPQIHLETASYGSSYGIKILAASTNEGGTVSSFRNIYKTTGSVNGRSNVQQHFSYIGPSAGEDYQYWSTGGSERMRIDGSGNVLVGTTVSTPGYGNQTIGFSILPDGRFFSSMGGTFGQINRNSDGAVLSFARSQTGVGQISVSSSSTSYGTSSDYRLKENVDYDWDATTRLKQLKPARFNFIADETNTPVDGFIAHEVSSIVPEAIIGTKDAMTTEVLYVEGDELPDGKSIGDVKEASVPDYQGIDQSKLVPLLVKTIQELEARITALEA